MPGKLSPEDILDVMGCRRPFLESVLNAYKQFGGKHVIAGDILTKQFTYRQLFTRAFVLRRKLDPILDKGNPYVGVMLPNATGAMTTFISLHAMAKIPCMLNFSAGEANVVHACKIARIQTVLTSRSFIEKAKLENIAEALEKNVKVVYLEDFKKSVRLSDKLAGLCSALRVKSVLKPVLATINPSDPAVVLYTSGSEGVPKGVALSHINILSNIAQVCVRLELPPSHVVFNAMPIFHSFGLTVGMLMPLTRGIKTFLYPSPVHYKLIPPLIRDSKATIMLGTDTFYNGYANYGKSEHFKTVKLAVAGAEKLKESTRKFWLETFAVNILQGYGVTEASPVISVNTPEEHKTGTVGKLFPAMEARTEPVPGLEKGGRLFVRGPNVMLGYLKADQPGVIQPQGDWYDTGDIVDIDNEGYISILGRAKRFAKIAGEMVSLQAVEEAACGALADVAHAAIAIPDERKGEQVVLFTESKDFTREKLLQYAKANGIAEIFLPRQIIYLEAIPRLGNGKIDYVTLAKQKI